VYGRLIPAGGSVLDLMSSHVSHLPADLQLSTVAGLGMNEVELNANRRLTDPVVHDLNADPVLPFADETFDAVICTVSVDYLTRPFEVFAEVRRILKKDGVFAVTFSNRWFPTKVVRVWERLQEFERLGLVSEYFLRSGLFRDIHTFSQRGLPRPPDDPYYSQMLVADPVYAVWGRPA
jgi:SAM-dependent methyltransferase